MRVPIQVEKTSLPEWFLLELQGLFSVNAGEVRENSADAVQEPRPVGALRQSTRNQLSVLTLTQYELHGNAAKLTQPLLVLRKRSADSDHETSWWECVAFVREKMIFASRPRPRVPTNARDSKKLRE
jgi:hypothetical protein